MERNDQSRHVSRGLNSLRGNLLVAFQQSTNDCVANHSVGSRTTTSDRLNYFPLTFLPSTATLAERRGARATERVKECLGVFVRTTCCEPWRVRIDRFHSCLSSSSGSNFLRGIHLRALSPSRVTDIREAVRLDLPQNDENQRRRISFQRSKHLRWR